jgi:hypothetical protein
MKHSLLNPHKEIEASIMRIYGFSRDADFGDTCTTATGTFLGCHEKKIFGIRDHQDRHQSMVALQIALVSDLLVTVTIEQCQPKPARVAQGKRILVRYIGEQEWLLYQSEIICFFGKK